MPQLKKILIEKIMAPDPYFLVAHSNGLGRGFRFASSFFLLFRLSGRIANEKTKSGISLGIPYKNYDLGVPDFSA